MGTFRCGLLLAATLIAGAPAFAQAPTPGGAAPDQQQPATPPPSLPATVAPLDTNTAPVATPDVTTPVAPAPTVSTNKPVKPKAAALPTARGTIAAIDNVAMTVTINAKGKDEVFKVSSKTRIFNEAKPAILGDAKVGDKATIEFRNAKDKTKEALSLRIGGAGAPVASEHKAPSKGKKPSIKKKKAAAAKKSDGTATPASAPAGTETPFNPAPEPAPAPGGVTPLPTGPTPNP